MAATDPIRGSAYAGRVARLMAYVPIDDGGTVRGVRKADLTSVTYVVRNRGEQVGVGGTLDKNVVVFDTNQTGTTWTKTVGPGGGNFAFTLDGATYLPLPNRMYTVTVTFTLTGGEPFDVEFEIATLDSGG